MTSQLPASRDKLLFTPGPLTTSLSVKQTMLRDAGSWHFEFNEIVRRVRGKLLELSGVSKEDGYECVLMQGSGTFGVESVIGSVVPNNGKILILSNGAYGERMVQMAKSLRIESIVLRTSENQLPDLNAVRTALEQNLEITHVAMVHCETTTGILNPISEVGQVVKAMNRSYIVDAMSSFGAISIDFNNSGIDYLISSANKCIEGVPGFSFVIARRASLLSSEGNARSLSLDLLGQWKAFEKTGQFRYTPPTHSILAFAEALKELEIEGGIPARAARYKRNHEVLIAEMKKLGFQPYLTPAVQSYIITSFHYPPHPNFQFTEFYRGLSDKGMIIYPGKLTQIDCFRIGSIGRIFETDVRCLVTAVKQTLEEMAVPIPVS